MLNWLCKCGKLSRLTLNSNKGIRRTGNRGRKQWRNSIEILLVGIRGLPIGFCSKRKSPTLCSMGDLYKRIRRRPTLPPSHPGSTIGAEELNFRVRNGNGCILPAIATENQKTEDRRQRTDLKILGPVPYAASHLYQKLMITE
jgi:hypothetical protein